MADVIIVGGGLAGCVVASRLHERRPSLSIVLIEAGPDAKENPHVIAPAGSAQLHFSDLDYKYFTVPQKHLDGKPKYNCGVKALGGGTVINYGGWTRGDAKDYDEWAAEVGDKRWSYDGLLPYFKRSETHHDPEVDSAQHGVQGPVHTASVTSSGRKYPLRNEVLKLFLNLGLEYKHDLNDGQPQNISDLVESWRDGKRQIAASTYPLEGIRLLTSSVVHRILIDESKTCTGVELTNGSTIELKADGQIILSAGAYRTPQILMLSGIGNSAHLSSNDIPVIVDISEVGQNLHDHLIIHRYWKLRHAERGLAVGSPLFGGLNYEKGGPIDFVVRTPLAHSPAESELLEVNNSHAANGVFDPSRSHLEFGILYAPFGASMQGLDVPLDGSAIDTFAMACLPTSRGSVTLASADPGAVPVIDPNYLETGADKHVLREAYRTYSSLMLDTPEGRDMVVEEFVASGAEALGLSATDEQIDKKSKPWQQHISIQEGQQLWGRLLTVA